MIDCSADARLKALAIALAVPPVTVTPQQVVAAEAKLWAAVIAARSLVEAVKALDPLEDIIPASDGILFDIEDMVADMAARLSAAWSPLHMMVCAMDDAENDALDEIYAAKVAA